MSKPTKHKLDIFHVLDRISRKDPLFFNNLDEEQQKAFSPLVVMRWLSGTYSPLQIVLLNQLVNHLVFPLGKHKGLLYDLMTICTSGKTQRYVWNKMNSKKSVMPKSVAIIQEYYGYSKKHSLEALPLLTNEDIISHAEDLGKQKDEIRELKKELKSR